MTPNPEKNRFGTQTVTPDEKTSRVRGVFDSVADRYDLMNDLMSGGLHRLWKDRFIRMIRPRLGLRYLDVAGGTGDIAFQVKRRISESQNLRKEKTPSKIRRFRDSEIPITLLDLNEQMLRVGRDRAVDRGWLGGFDWIAGNAESLPFADNHFDVYTIAFGLRNVTHIDTALAEACRVLKPGGRFYCLEFSRVDNPILKKIYDAYSFGVIPHIGQIVAQDRASYQYLVESIRAFPSPNKLKARMQSAGFSRCEALKLSAGIVCIHSGMKQ